MPFRAFVRSDTRWHGRPQARVADNPYDSEDARHVARAQSGDAEAFGALVQKYQTKIYGIVYRMCGAGDDVADLGQEIFLRALTALRKFQYQGEASFRTWLYRIAVNVCINELRRRKRKRRIEGASLDEMVSTETGLVERMVPDLSTAPHHIAERKETCDVVHRILQAMSPQHRAVLTLVDIQGMPYEEAAQVISCNLGTLKSRLSRARRAFGARYQEFMAHSPATEAQDAAG
jgi:RNA polymerase sigma-70 factor, ECF subfamily